MLHRVEDPRDAFDEVEHFTIHTVGLKGGCKLKAKGAAIRPLVQFSVHLLLKGNGGAASRKCAGQHL